MVTIRSIFSLFLFFSTSPSLESFLEEQASVLPRPKILRISAPFSFSLPGPIRFLPSCVRVYVCVCMRVFFIRTVTYLHSSLSGPFPGHIDRLGFLVYRPTASLLTLRGDLGHLTRADRPESTLWTPSSPPLLLLLLLAFEGSSNSHSSRIRLSHLLSQFRCRGRRSPLQ